MSVTTTITVAAGVFAAGHLGELTRIVPFELADAALEEEGGLERRVRLAPSRAGLYFLLAMCLFPRAGYQGVWGKLTAGLRVLGLAAPSGKALRDLRRRIGIPPVRRLFEILAGPLGQPRTPGIMFRGYRTVSFDGCKSVKVPDTVKNRAWLGKQKASNGETGYPALALMALVETGTRALLGAVFGPGAEGEPDRRHRPRRPREPARPPAAPRLRPQGQVPAQPLEQAPRRQTPRKPPHNQHHRPRRPSYHHPATGGAPDIRDKRSRTRTSRHWG